MAFQGRPSPEGTEEPSLLRFDAVERGAHWLLALMFVTLILTGAALYISWLVELVGRRRLVERVHVDVGLALPLPLLVSLAGSWGKGLRQDIRRLNRWSADDQTWLYNVRHLRAPRGLQVGKFNAGQKLNAAFTVGAGLVMLMTGSMMHWKYDFGNDWLTGATFVHGVLAYALTIVVVGHILMALLHPQALKSIFTGKVSRRWAAEHAPLWLADLVSPEEQ